MASMSVQSTMAHVVSDRERNLCLLNNMEKIRVCGGILAEVWVANESHLLN